MFNIISHILAYIFHKTAFFKFSWFFFLYFRNWLRRGPKLPFFGFFWRFETSKNAPPKMLEKIDFNRYSIEDFGNYSVIVIEEN